MLYFFHIPKTAGTSLRAMLTAHFPLDRALPNDKSFQYLWGDLIKVPPEQLERYALVCGHYYNPLYQRLRRTPVTITMLREPVAQALSAYQNIWQFPEHYFHQKARQMANLGDFLRDTEVRRLFSNFQTRMLALDPDIKRLNASINRADPQALQKAIELAIPDMPDAELLARAKARLDSFALVGVIEQFPESIWLLDYLFGWWPETQPAHLNISPSDKDERQVSTEIQDMLRELNTLDFEVYRYAEQRFNADFAQMMTELLADRAITLHPLPARQIIDIPFDQHLPGAGWYPPERDSEGQLFRWLGPAPHASITLALPADRPITIEGYIAFGISFEILNSLTLTVGTRSVPLTFKAAAQYSYTFTGIIPPHTAASHLTHLTFRVNRAVSPRERDPQSADKRLLSLAFRWLRLSFASIEKW